ncbi:hypothetical protein GGR53DRAFT_522602 [Hypoxylon sp. FL1150]|nr:hypothetical protein GGR53DRAFT_522602 [Hypoxylon sp. FL1150]
MRLFLILVMLSNEEREKISLLADLERSNITDGSLPIGFDGLKKGHYQRWHSLESSSKVEQPFYGKWAIQDCDLLSETYQWLFLAPVFSDDAFQSHFFWRRPLPYLKIPIEKKQTAKGSFGKVSRAVIHISHLQIPSLCAMEIDDIKNGEGVAIAIKKARHDAEDDAGYFDKEASNLKKLQLYMNRHKSPHLIRPIAAYKIDQDRCLVSLWAEGGTLLNYWERYEDQRRDADSVRWLLGQLKGVCSAIAQLHRENTRHGDLKPDNILWFKKDDHGIFQIADLGLTTFHEKEKDTRDRKGIKTITFSGTYRYEPPEIHEKRDTQDARSRQYDIWSIGCVLLESLIWLIYGYDGVKQFQGLTARFWKYEGKMYCVDPYVDSCMKEIMRFLPDDSAYKDLLSIVQERLLVVAVSEDYHKPLPADREIAEVLHEKMAVIVEKSDQSKEKKDSSPYLRPLTSRYPADIIRGQQTSNKIYNKGGGLGVPSHGDAPEPSPTSSTHNAPGADSGTLVPRVVIRAATEKFDSNPPNANVSTNTIHQQHSSTFNDEWESVPDNEFAISFFNSPEWDKVKPEQPTAVQKLCESCSAINSTDIFNGEYNLIKLQLISRRCSLCSLLFRALESAGIEPPRVVTLKQDGATVKVEDGPKLLSIYSEPGSNLPNGAQLGLPKLLQPASGDQFALFKRWIEVCDEKHDGCRRKNINVSTMPTRLIEVSDRIRLIDSAAISPSPYVALSHCWGQVDDNTKFCTFKHNIDQLRRSIDPDDIPPLFKDAVSIVRGLGFKYIWIDSLCIIQDDKQDWAHEAGRMEQVFSGAYVTIAASSAKSSNEGFLEPREPRSCVQLSTQNSGRVYVCPNIDNFHQDVELGALNRRGWVLQERVLSRRSIYFSSTQVYWECSDGVHCETLTRLHNSKSGFLGDANFPESALKHYRDGRQVLVQDLYERYSELAFTEPSDRSMAILGLQKRLKEAFKTKVAFGLLDTYFARGLLWKRRGMRMMKRIDWRDGRPVPSWSWLSKEGSIKYMDLQYSKVDWATEEYSNPISRQATTIGFKPSDGQDDKDLPPLRGRARRLLGEEFDMRTRTTFDASEEFDFKKLRCVVVGRDNINNGTEELKQHVLIIYPFDGLRKEKYERVGVASLKEEHVGEEDAWVTIC